MRRLVAVLALAAAAGLALAQTGNAPRPVLHEPLADTPAHGSPMIGAGSAGNPAAFTAGDKVLPEPARDRATMSGEPVLGKGGFAADRDTQMRPDDHTGADPTLHYASVFNPDVVPFKRMSAFDQIGPDETLHVAQTALADVAVGGTTDPRTRDRFWGDVLVQLQPGRDVALPSVAPDMRILSYETTPRVALRFSKDGADNFYVRSDEASASGTYRLVFLADADAGYFAPKLPPHTYRVRDVVAHAPPELRDQLAHVSPALEQQARITLARIGADRDMDLGVAFNKLVGYFRAFQPGELARSTGDLYRDLCDSQTGVCRHRSFAFMITANALGIPTRYVENEAHAFVEVWFPERNWQRIDLGGAALRLDVGGAQDKTLHRPRSDDPFVKPPEYERGGSYTQLEGDVRGLTDRQLADKHRPLDQAPASGDTGGIGNGGGGSGGAVNAGALGSAAAGSARGDRISPDPTLPAVTPDPKKPTPVLRVTTADTSAYRGGALHVEGIVTVDHKPLADHAVRVFIAPAGAGRTHAIPLGLATTGADGTFHVDLTVPAAASLETYDLLLSCDEDAYYNAAISE